MKYEFYEIHDYMAKSAVLMSGLRLDRVTLYVFAVNKIVS